MKHERILPRARALLVSSLRLNGLMPRPRNLFRWLRWQQWLLLFSLGAAVIVAEVHSHTVMWRTYDGGRTIWSDPMLLWEISLFGLVFPILAGVILGHLARTAFERDEIARELAWRRSFVAQLQQARSLAEIAQLVVSLPGHIASARRAWLLAPPSGEEAFAQIAQWQAHGAGLSPSPPPVTPAICEVCVEATTRQGSRLLTCRRAGSGNGSRPDTRYCLWLSADGTGKAALLFDVPPDRFLSMGQVTLLDELGDEISLALGRTHLHYMKQQQDDVIRSERLRIARDLHDTLGQNISYLRFKLERLNDTGPGAGRTALQDELARMLVVAEEAYEQVRDTLEKLRMTERRELEEMVRLYADQVATRSQLSVNVHASGRPLILSTLRVRQLMYIVREALNNVEKHAGAHQVDIHLCWSEHEFSLTVRDDGSGFDSEEIQSENQYGMHIMAERARAINAEVAITSSPGQGTELRVILPLSVRNFDGRQPL